MTATDHKSFFRLWAEAWSLPGFRVQFSTSVVLLIVALHMFTRFLLWVEGREGVTLNDPLLRLIEPRDFTWATFGVIYVALTVALVYLLQRPHDLLLALQAYTLMVVVRAVMMFLLPLNPAEGLIVLEDPFVQFAGDGSAPTKDLFFSGHTATLFLLFLIVRQRTLKAAYLFSAVLVAVFVVWQHVHYVVDVAVAPFVAYGCYRAVTAVQERMQVQKES
jgi:hypothetical protein